MNNQYKGPMAWDNYLSALEAATPTIQAIAVTDYYVLETYQEILKRKAAGRLPDANLVFPNVELRLDVALQANFPVTYRIVGEEFFRAMARDYVAVEPPTSPILFDYGAGFPDFIGRFKPVEPLPYLSDVARIERAWTEAYNAAEALPLNPDALATIPNLQVSEVRFELHPSLRVVRSRFPALTIWRMNVADGVPAPVDLDSGGEDILLVRPSVDVELYAIPLGGADLIIGLAGGQSLTEAAKSTLIAFDAFDLSANLSALIDAGAFVGFNFAKPAKSPHTGANAK